MACRVTPAPDVRSAIDRGPSSAIRFTRRRRVGSPSAAKTSAASGTSLAALVLRDIAFDVRHLCRPAAAVLRERFGAASDRDPIEAGFDDGQACAAVFVGERK